MKPWQKRTGDEKAYQSTKSVVRKTFLILCENVMLEPNYFRSIPVRTAQVKAFGVFESKLELVSKAKEYIKQSHPDKDCEIWLVFNYHESPDHPPIEPEDFNRAVAEAQSLGYRVAWSHQAFELWLLLHFQEVDQSYTKAEYGTLLSQYFRGDFPELSRKAVFCRQMYAYLERNGSQKEAVARAKALFTANKGKEPAASDPCTSVFELVEELNHYLKP